MPQTQQHTEAAANYTVLVTFTWGSTDIARYTRWSENLTVGGEVFTAVPQLSAKLKKPMEGGTSAEEIEVTMPINLAPLISAIEPYKHPEIKVKVEEFSPGGGDSTVRSLFFGRVGKIKVAPSGAAALARIQVKGIKARLAETRIGMQALSTCIHTFGDDLCGFNLAGAKDVIIPTVLSVGGVPNRMQGVIIGSPNMANDRWARGFLRFDTVNITIRKIEDEGTNPNPVVTIDLREVPPPSWIGKSVDIFPGCNKTIEACRDPFRDRESEFLGPGIAMLPYNPGFSDAPNA